MKTVWKYEWPMPMDRAEFEMPAGAEILHAREQRNAVCLWAKVDDARPKEKRQFILSGTGHPAPDGKYIGTASLFDGNLILHVFEVA